MEKRVKGMCKLNREKPIPLACLDPNTEAYREGSRDKARFTKIISLALWAQSEPKWNI